MVEGLTSDQARELLLKYGPNEPAPRRRRTLLIQFLLLFANPLVAIILIAGVVSFFLGQWIDGSIIITVVFLGVVINFLQTWRSQLAADRLQEQVAPTATVLRDGEWREIPRLQVVPGDVLKLSAGDLIPADARILESRDLYVQQAALTGESLPAEKLSQAAGEQNLVYLGTSVVSGTAQCLVLRTGAATMFGDIATRLTTRPEETAFESGIRHFGLLILRATFFLVLFIAIVSIVMRRDPFESLLFAVALAVGLTPEFLPMITSVTLAQGAVRMARRHVIVKQLPAIQNLGSIDILCSDKTGTLTTGHMVFHEAVDGLGAESPHALLLAYLNSRFETGIRSPLDAAILQESCPEAGDYEKRDEIPFDFERRRVSVVVEPAARAGELLITKGAPEGILGRSDLCETGGHVVPLDERLRESLLEQYRRFGDQGFRVLAVAWRPIEPSKPFTAADECSLIFAGFLTFTDPPLPDAAAALADLRSDGVSVKIVTGDSERVTAYICSQVGLDASGIVLGDEIERATDTALGHIVENNTIFARVSPAQKNRIILALKHRGHTVGYMGDGINDAPSLRAADVGISVSTAVDVARDAAEIILVQPGLRVLHNGILEGRRAFGNVMKYLLMGTSSNFGNMFSMAGASLFLPFLPMLPTQILLNNFLYDLAQITIPTDNVDDEYVRGPQHWDISLIRNFMIFIGPISSIYDFLTFYVLLHFFRSNQALFHTGWFVESLATQTLVLFVIRTMRNPFRSRPSHALAFTTVAIVALGIVLPVTPLGAPLGFVALPAAYFGFLAAAVVTYLWLVEVVKRRLFSKALSRS